MEDKNFFEFRAIPLQKSQFQIQKNPNSKDFDIDPSVIDYETTIKSKEFNDYILLRKSRINRWNWAYQKIMESTLESIDSIKVVAPAYKRGIPVNTEFTLPIILKTQGL